MIDHLSYLWQILVLTWIELTTLTRLLSKGVQVASPVPLNGQDSPLHSSASLTRVSVHIAATTARQTPVQRNRATLQLRLLFPSLATLAPVNPF